MAAGYVTENQEYDLTHGSWRNTELVLFIPCPEGNHTEMYESPDIFFLTDLAG